MFKFTITSFSIVGIFAFEWYATMTFTTIPANVWLAISIACFIMVILIAYHQEIINLFKSAKNKLPQKNTYSRIVKNNPSNGMAVAHLIMQAKTMADVERLFADFDKQDYQGSIEGQCHVAAARRIRQLRSEGVDHIMWNISDETQRLQRKFGESNYRKAVHNLMDEYRLEGMGLYDMPLDPRPK